MEGKSDDKPSFSDHLGIENMHITWPFFLTYIAIHIYLWMIRHYSEILKIQKYLILIRHPITCPWGEIRWGHLWFQYLIYIQLLPYQFRTVKRRQRQAHVHWILIVVMMPTLSSLMTLQVVIKTTCSVHYDVIKWKHFPRYWPFVRGIHWSPVNSPHKGQWRGALMFS